MHNRSMFHYKGAKEVFILVGNGYIASLMVYMEYNYQYYMKEGAFENRFFE